MTCKVNADTTNGLKLTSDTSGEIDLQTNGTTKVHMDSSGNVGIGTSSPNTNLHISDTGAINRNNLVFSTPNDGTNYNALVGGNLVVDASGTYTTPATNISGSGIEFSSANSLNDHGYIRFLSAPDTNSESSTPLERMRIDSSGRVTKPYQPAFKATMSAAQNNFATGYTTIQFDTESFDIGSNFNTTTYTFTAPVDGRYLFTATVGMKNLPVNAQWFILQIAYTGGQISDNQSTGQWDGDSDTNRNTSFRCAGIADLDANDTAHVRFYQYTGTAQADTANSSTHTQFNGILLG